MESFTDEKTGKKTGRGSRTAVELEKMGVNEPVPFPHSHRRKRNNFTKEEDDALLRGFQKFQTQWKKIQTDPELGLEHRTRTDLRDRFRNRYPEEFKEAGLRLHGKKRIPTMALQSIEMENDDTAGTAPGGAMEENDVAMGSSALGEASHPLRLLTAGLYDTIDPDLLSPATSMSSGDESGQGIRLSRNIFDWADQNKNLNSSTRPGQLSSEGRTLTTLDQYHMNPLLAPNKIPALLNPESSVQPQQAQHVLGQQSIVPLSRILNATTLEDRPREI